MEKSERRIQEGPLILAIDLGGTHVKVLLQGTDAPRELKSGPKMGPAEFVAAVQQLTADWRFDRISLGYPGLVVHGRIAAEPAHLGPGWVDFDVQAALGRPVRMINDAAMQALGSYQTGSLLFLGVGTGLGSALVIDGKLAALELGHLPYRKGKTFEQYAGAAALARLGKKKWRKHVHRIVDILRAAVEADEVVIGGGNASKLKRLPKHARLGSNAYAFRGGFLLWPEQSKIEGETNHGNKLVSDSGRH